MTTRTADSEFSFPETSWGAPPAPSFSVVADRPGTRAAEQTQSAVDEQGVLSVNSELDTLASTIEELRSRLEQTNSRLSSAEKVEITEFEIGRLFIEAQQFTETSLSKLELRIHEVLGEAEAKARQILAEATLEARQIHAHATQEAQKIREDAQDDAVTSTRTVQELQSAMAGFTAVNAELLKELDALNNRLAPGTPPGVVEVEHFSPAGRYSTQSS